MNNEARKQLEEMVLANFLRYVKIDTMSDPCAAGRPTTPGQLELLTLLEQELKQLGVTDLDRVDDCFLIARVPGRHNHSQSCIGLMAHVDTSSEVSGKNVQPRLHTDYQGQALRLNEQVCLDPLEFSDLLEFKGDTLITADGNTLLGADDKAGMAEIMAALAFLLADAGANFPDLEIIFTTDEETGRGMDNFPLSRLRAGFCYTFDGGEDGALELENFEAYKVNVKLQGRSFHLGKARGRLINSIQLLQAFLALLPAAELPETTEKREGYYCPIDVSGTIETSEVQLLIRDFEEEQCLRRIEVLRHCAAALERSHPGAVVEVTSEKQYANMRRFLGPGDQGVDLLAEAVRLTGIEPVYTIIRGGTDGSRLSELGIPTPNVFTGGYNFHSRYEWIPLSAMVRAAQVIVHLTGLWAAAK